MESYWPTAADQPNPSKHDIEHSQWYKSVEKVIVSKTMEGTQVPHTTFISENLPNEIRQLKQKNGKEIILFGSPTLTHSLMEENLIDDYWLFVNPILLGKGTRYFKNLKNGIKLKLLTSTVFTSGVVCLHYEADTSK
jgi:dihydrofolate reductase